MGEKAKDTAMIIEIFESVNDYSRRSRSKEQWEMVFNHLYSALICIKTKEDIDCFRKNYFSYIGQSNFFKNHTISINIQSILNQEIYDFEKAQGLGSFKDQQDSFFFMVKNVRKKEEEKDDREWEAYIDISKNGGLCNPFFYLD